MIGETGAGEETKNLFCFADIADYLTFAATLIGYQIG
jgi:hypothetical protein